MVVAAPPRSLALEKDLDLGSISTRSNASSEGRESPTEDDVVASREFPPALQDLGRQAEDEVWLVIGGTGVVGYGVLRALSQRGEAGGLVLAPTRGCAEKAWMEGALPGITALQADVNDPAALRKILQAYPPVTHVFYSALIRTTLDSGMDMMAAMDIRTIREFQRNMSPAFIGGLRACCCGGTGIYDVLNSMAGCGDIEDNRELFTKIFQALDLTKLRYCCLVTGAKQYGMHLGPNFWAEYCEPFHEHVQSPGESVYAVLEEELQGLAARLPQLCTLSLRPTFILGPVPRPSSSCMNLSLCLGVYAMLCKELGQPLRFLGCPELWTAHHNFSHSRRVAQLALNGAASLMPDEAGRSLALNCSDAESFRYADLWPEFAAWAGVPWEGPAGRNGLSLVKSMGRTMEQLHVVWDAVVARYSLRRSRLDEVLNFIFLEQSMTVCHSARLSADKCKSLEWASPCRDGGWATLRQAFADLSSQRLLPDMP